MNGYNLSRSWFDWAFENPDLNTPVHTALFMWVVEKWNRLGQKEKFGLPASEAMEVLGISSFNTYKKVFNGLVEWGFIEVIQANKNQYTATIIALSKSDRASDKALDKALIMQLPKQSQSNIQGTDSINKQENQEEKKPLNQETVMNVETGVPTTDVEEVLDEAVKKNPGHSNPHITPKTPPDAVSMDATFFFRNIWEMYDKKIGDRLRCEKKWNTLSDKEKWLAWQHIPGYVLSTPDKKYRANLETYLNQKRWNNEIIETHAKRANRSTTAAVRPLLEKPRVTGGDPVRKNIFGKEEKSS